MKKVIKIFLSILILAGIAGYFIWQNKKHQVAKEFIMDSVTDLSDSLYSITYDSSMIDEINGEAYFENIVLKTDSAQLHQLRLSDQLPDVLVEVFIKSISADGIDIPLALNEKKLFANKIIINEPRIVITHTGKKSFKYEDSMALFKKILGNYNSIHAKSIEVVNASFIDKSADEIIHTQLANLSISFNKIIIDSTKDYKNVVSYFINNMKANAKLLYINQPNRNGAIAFDNITYNAIEKNISIDKISSFKESITEERFILNSIKLEDINVKDFIDYNTLNVGNISTGNCVLTLFINQTDESKPDFSKTKKFDFPDDYFDKIKIGGISIGKSTLLFKNKKYPNKEPVRLNGFTFHLSKNIKISERNSLRNILDSAKWNMQADDFTLTSKDNKYNISFKGLKVNKALSSAMIRSIQVKPIQSKTNNVLAYQEDIFDIEMKTILLTGLDINQFVNESALRIDEISLHLDLKVYHDRVPPDRPESKVGKYPHQLLMNLALPVDIRTAIITKSYASYKERSKETKEEGEVIFSNIEGIVNNITNNTLLIQQNPICQLKANGLLLGKAKCVTDWRLFLDSKNGKFEIAGQIGSTSFNKLNALTKPLALTTIEGQLNSLHFTMAGDDNTANGDIIMLYSSLKLASYKLSDKTNVIEATKTKSSINNFFVKNNNPSKGITRNAKFAVQRDPQKSFFNLIWKGVYDGIQNTILNKNVAEIKKQLK
ncbi:MAG: hypothetical protein IPI46_05970 [Bacteroidetes bacterium]|nr:hypothetical protein [Bacteroidota bacterium]